MSNSRDIRSTALSCEELRRVRAEHVVVLRKVRKDQQLDKIRNIQLSDFENEVEYDVSMALETANAKLYSNSDSAVLLENCLETMTSPGCSKQSQLESAQIARQIMKNASASKYDTENMMNKIVQNQSLLNKMVLVLKLEQSDYIDATRGECARVFYTIVSSGSAEQIATLEHLNGISALILALRNTLDEIVAKNCITAIGNYIQRDRSQRKIMEIETQLIFALMGIVKRFRIQISVLKALSWVLANLCRNISSYADLCLLLHHSLQPIAYMILLQDDKIVENACYALEYLISEESCDTNQVIFQTGIGPRLINLLNHQNPWIILRTLAVVGNILCNGEEKAQRLIDMGVLPQLVRLLESSNEQLVKEAAWSISNISAGSQNHINFIFESGAIPLLANILHSPNQVATKKEAVWTLTHLARTENPAHIEVLLHNCMLKSFCHLLSSTHIDKSLVYILLKGLHRVLKQSKKIGDMELKFCTNIIEECGGVEYVEKYEYDENDDVHNYAWLILGFIRKEQEDSDFE